MGSNEVLGLEEAFVGNDIKMCTVRCISNEGKAWQIKKEDLFRVIKGDDAREKVREFVQTKLSFMAQRVDMISNTFHQLK